MVFFTTCWVLLGKNSSCSTENQSLEIQTSGICGRDSKSDINFESYINKGLHDTSVEPEYTYDKWTVENYEIKPNINTL